MGTQRIIKFLPVALTQAEWEDRANSVARLSDEISDAERRVDAEKEAAKARVKDAEATLEGLRAKQRALSRVVRERKEERDVACSVALDRRERQAVTTRDDTGAEVDRRPLSDAEIKAGATWRPNHARERAELIHPDEPGLVLDTRPLSEAERQLDLLPSSAAAGTAAAPSNDNAAADDDDDDTNGADAVVATVIERFAGEQIRMLMLWSASGKLAPSEKNGLYQKAKALCPDVAWLQGGRGFVTGPMPRAGMPLELVNAARALGEAFAAHPAGEPLPVPLVPNAGPQVILEVDAAAWTKLSALAKGTLKLAAGTSVEWLKVAGAMRTLPIGQGVADEIRSRAEALKLQVETLPAEPPPAVVEAPEDKPAKGAKKARKAADGAS